MLKTLKQIWTFLSEVSGVVATSGIFIYSIKYFFTKMNELLKVNIGYFILLTIALLVSGIFLFYLLKDKIFKFIDSFKKENLKEKLSPSVLINKKFDISKAIPPETTFNSAKELSLKEGLSWSKDAKISSFNFYIHKVNNKITYTIQIYLFSVWKAEQMVIYYPNISKNYEKTNDTQDELGKYFFEIPKWRQAIIRAYEKISSKISNEFDLQITETSKYNYPPEDLNNEISINFTFKTGQVKERFSFTFDGEKLICKEDKTEILI